MLQASAMATVLSPRALPEACSEARGAAFLRASSYTARELVGCGGAAEPCHDAAGTAGAARSDGMPPVAAAAGQ